MRQLLAGFPCCKRAIVRSAFFSTLATMVCAWALAAERPASSYKPSDRTYRVRLVAQAEIQIDGCALETGWDGANKEQNFVFPWKKDQTAPRTSFKALCDDKYLYFAFQVDDNDIVVLDKPRDKQDLLFEDRCEMYFCRDPEMKDCYCAEFDSRGRIMDYQSSYYRNHNFDWRWPQLEAKGAQTPNGYTVEGRVPLATFESLGFPRLRPGVKILCGLYRAEFSHDRSGRPVVHGDTLHNLGRQAPGVPPLEDWMSWIDPKTPEPDFHVPSSLGWLEIVE